MLDEAQLTTIAERLAQVERLRAAALPDRSCGAPPAPELVEGLLDSHTAALALLDEVRRLRAAPARRPGDLSLRRKEDPSPILALCLRCGDALPDTGSLIADPGRGFLAFQSAIAQLWMRCAGALAGEEPE